MRSVRFVAHGRVQGVFFRRFTQQTATRLGLAGWVRNRPDGTVEGEATGPSTDIDALLDALREGPDDARVDRLDAFDTDRAHQGPFEVVR